jgi:hypothetical protein
MVYRSVGLSVRLALSSLSWGGGSASSGWAIEMGNLAGERLGSGLVHWTVAAPGGDAVPSNIVHVWGVHLGVVRVLTKWGRAPGILP